ncbi:hypothetical protein CMZ84_04215 [Lysobacteraceae bacterium NML93-0399]|nr:hypothetical protein CMZ84_04215 [Xanthomonadaceae bacterium NML93-0399]
MPTALRAQRLAGKRWCPMFDAELHLFIFRRQGVTLRFAAADRDIEIGEHVYHAAQIERDAIKQTAERAKDKLKIRVAYLLAPVEPTDGWPVTQALGDWWRPHIPSDEISVICLSYRPGSDELPDVEWMGWAVQPAYSDAQLEINCDSNPPHGSAPNQGPKWQRACFKTVYSTGIRGCNLPAGGYLVPAELTAVAGNTITAEALVNPKRTFVGGYVQWQDATDPELTHRRAITAHEGATVMLADDVGDLAVGAQVSAYTRGFWVTGEVAQHGVDDLTLQVPAFAGTEFSLVGGTLSWTRSDGLVEERPIMSHNNTTGAVTLLWGGADLSGGLFVSALPNCPNTWAACAARRPDPELHYGGAIYKPVRDPIVQGVAMSWG